MDAESVAGECFAALEGPVREISNCFYEKHRGLEQVLMYAGEQRTKFSATQNLVEVIDGQPYVLRVKTDIPKVSDITRFRLYDAEDPKNLRLIGFVSADNQSDFWQYQKRRAMPIDMDTCALYIRRGENEIEQEAITSPWCGRNAMIFAIHQDPVFYDGLVTRRSPGRNRPSSPDWLHVDGKTTADLLWATGSFQNAASKDASRPIVVMACDAAGPRSNFANEFSERMFDLGFRAPLHFASDTASVFEAEGGGCLVIGFERKNPAVNPIVTYQPPNSS